MSDRGSELSKRRLTLCVVGSGGVGKSSITLRYLNDQFPEFYDPTVEESYITKVEYGANMHDVEIIDTAGQEEFMSFRDSSMVHGDAFMALCAINSYSSWTELKVLREKIIREQDGDMNVPIVVVANKRDLEDSRQVPVDDIVAYCKQIDCPLMETSAKTGLNVSESFRLLMDRINLLKPDKFKDSIIPEESEDYVPDQAEKKCTIS